MLRDKMLWKDVYSGEFDEFYETRGPWTIDDAN